MTSLTFYGGVNEIGGNTILLRGEKTSILLDFGMSFSQVGKYYEEFLKPRTNNFLGDCLCMGLLPRIDGLYRDDLVEVEGVSSIIPPGCSATDYWVCDVQSYKDCKECGEKTIDAVVITHAHLDHSQYITLVDKEIPIYSSAVTKELLCCMEEIGTGDLNSEFTNMKRVLSSETGSRGFFPGTSKLKKDNPTERKWKPFSGNEELKIGEFTIKTYPVDHSVPGSTAYLIEDKNGKKIVYTGDFRFHGIQGELTSKFEEEIKNEAPDILITEGTRIDEEIKDDEEKVFQDTLNRVKSTTGLVMVDFAWKDITRYLTMKKVAEASKKTLVISSKLAYVIHKLKKFANLNIKSVEKEDNVKVFFRRKYGMLYSESDYVNTKYDLGYSTKWDRNDRSTISEVHFKNGVRAYQIREKPSQYMLQLAFYDLSELIDLKPPPGSVYIKATSEPFDEEMKFDEKRLCNWFERFGLNAPECKPIYINASGHAYGPEIKDFISRVQPGIIIPIHTKNPEEFEKSFANVVVPEKGVPIDINTL